MNGRGYEDRDMDDFTSPADFVLSKRFYSILMHPDCPVHLFDYEVSKLARHIAIRYGRVHPKRKVAVRRGRKKKVRARKTPRRRARVQAAVDWPESVDQA